MMRRGLTAAAIVALAACATEAPTYRELERMGSDYERGGTSPFAAPQTKEEATARNICGAAAFRDRVGTPVSDMTVPQGARVIAPGTAVTDDFRPSRLNIITDADGVVTALECY